MVERYNCHGWDIRRGEMRREDDGHWVPHSDYAALERQIAELRASPPPSGDVVNDGERCDNCGRNYAVIYRVPDGLWSKIAPHKKTLGPHSEHQGGGLLCPDCASAEAGKIGITLRFDTDTEWSSAPATADGWLEEPLNHPYEDWRKAINFAIETDEPQAFLKCWNHGEWNVLDRDWPEWSALFPAAPTATGGR